MQKIILLFLSIFMLFGISNLHKEDYYIIPNESIRIRIVPNSNSIPDQLLKAKVKNNMETELIKDLKTSKTIKETKQIIKSNLNKYDNLINKILKDEHKNIKYNINYGKHYFPEKKYKGVKYKKGYYESLLITLGNRLGNNWWCILFPPICTFEQKENIDNIKYTSYIKEMINKYIK